MPLAPQCSPRMPGLLHFPNRQACANPGTCWDNSASVVRISRARQELRAFAPVESSAGSLGSRHLRPGPERKDGQLSDTSSDEYAERLVERQRVWWKRALNVQAPYRWNLRRLGLGRVLDVGCGIGRNLAALDGNGVGVDHNKSCVPVVRSLGLVAYR